MIVRLTERQISILIEETKDRYPIEACGLLFGDIDEEEATVRRITAIHNTLESRTEFQLDPEEFLKALSEAEKQNLQHIGFFHSHPAPPRPSATDRTHMKLWPGSIWLIVSSINHGIAAYRAINGVPEKADLKVSDGER